MISAWLLGVVRCPDCVRRQGETTRLIPDGAQLRCAICGAEYPIRDGYLDLRPRREIAGKETVYVDADADLDDPQIRAPVLSAGVRLRVLRLMLRPRASNTLLDIGCGNGKFAVWNRDRVRHIVGLDPAARFAPRARAEIDLVQGDARALPFVAGAFDSAYTIDVFEHLDGDGVRDHLAEVRRVVGRGGGYFCFSNTRERSWLNLLIDPGRRLAESLHRRGLVDRSRDHLRKGDHVKAVETTEALFDAFNTAGLGIRAIWFLNPLLATGIETLGLAIIEQLLARRATGTPGADGPQRTTETVRDAAAGRRAVRLALDIGTALLMADVVFFRRVRTGPFFLLARPDAAR